MQYGLVVRVLGLLLCGEAVLMAPSLLISLLYPGKTEWSFLISMLLLLLIGLPMALLSKPKGTLYPREGFAIVGLGWIFLSAFGALPFFLSGAIPSYIDAFFEAVSGFTTTGATILTEVEHVDKGLLFWRSFTHWVGGMGVLVLSLALLPQLSGRNLELLKAESPGPTVGKLVPRLRDTARYMYLIYLVMTIIEIILLVIAKMPLYDAVIHTLGTAGTGGFSNRNLSVGAYGNGWIELIIGAFMLLFGVNFTLYFAFLTRKFKRAFASQELYLYLIIVALAILLITINILPTSPNGLTALRQSAFQVSSIITTTGYATTDFNLWPMLSRVVLLFLMIVGACAGSTGGGLKVVRLLLLGKALRRELHYILHPRAVRQIRLDRKPVEENTMRSVLVFFFSYIAITAAAMLIIAFDNHPLDTTFSAVLATIGNIGPGIGLVGPIGNFSIFSPVSKLVLSFCMLAGRLEILPILVLFKPSLWKRI